MKRLTKRSIARTSKTQQIMTDSPLHPAPTASQGDLATAGRDAGKSMIAAAQAANGPAPVSIDSATFLKLGELLVALARIAERCGGEDCLARPVNGVRSWVPAQILDDSTRRLQVLERDNEALRAALATIVESRPSLLPRRNETPQALARAALDALRSAAR